MSDKPKTNLTIDELDDFCSAAGAVYTKHSVSIESPEVQAAVQQIAAEAESRPMTEEEEYEACKSRLESFMDRGWIVLRQGEHQILLDTTKCTAEQFHEWVQQVYPPAVGLAAEGKFKVADWESIGARNKAIQRISNLTVNKLRWPVGSMKIFPSVN